MSRERSRRTRPTCDQHLVALLVAVDVVDLLEVVDVHHHQAQRAVEAPRALDLAVERGVQLADVREPGQLVGDRLALDGLVEVRVLDRDARLAGEVLEQLALLAGELRGPRDRHQRDVRRGRRRGGPGSAPPARARPGCGPRPPGRCRGQAEPRRPGRSAPPPPSPPWWWRPRCRAGSGSMRSCASGHRAAGLGLARVDRGVEGQLEDSLRVEPRGERGAHPPDGLLQLAALAVELLDLGLELLGHAVELAAQESELVAARGWARGA